MDRQVERLRTGRCPGRSGLLLLTALVAFPGYALAQDTPSQPRNPLRELNQALEELSRAAAPAVVQVFTTGFTTESGKAASGAVRRNNGSGVIIDSDGYILTNAHVVTGAQKIEILRIPPEEGIRDAEGSLVRPKGLLLEATLVGYDLETDIAVLKANLRVLRFLKFGDSDTLRKGQLVFAFGNPQGSGDSMSMGVVSSVARQLDPEDPVVYVQTDASIKPGNNGGPLVNIEGQIVGLNNSSVGDEAARSGFGFALPSNIVRGVYEQLRQNGRVQRGVTGAIAQTITPELAGPLGLPRDRGVIIADVIPLSPADFAGLRIGDVVLTLNGKPMENARQFNVNIYQYRPGEAVSLEVLRNGQATKLEVPVVDRGDDPSRFSKLANRQQNLIPKLGIVGLELDDEVSELIPFLRSFEGVLVAEIAGGLSAAAEFQPGDIILSINGKPTKTLAALQDDLGARQTGEVIVVQIERQSLIRYATLTIE